MLGNLAPKIMIFIHRLVHFALHCLYLCLILPSCVSGTWELWQMRLKQIALLHVFFHRPHRQQKTQKPWGNFCYSPVVRFSLLCKANLLTNLCCFLLFKGKLQMNTQTFWRTVSFRKRFHPDFKVYLKSLL